MGVRSILEEWRVAALKLALLAAACIGIQCGALAQSASAGEMARLLQQAQVLAAAGNAAGAYAVLAAREDDYLGEIDFDYALGRAALDAGRPDRATLAFSRVLALDRRHAGAAIDLGRAYLALGNREQARAVFEGLLALDPPAEIRAQLESFLGRARVAQAPRTAVSGYLAGSGGRDTNVNAAAAQSRVFVPAFGADVQLAGRNVRRADNYLGLAEGVDLVHAVDERFALVGGADGLHRRNARESQFDIDALALRAGAAWAGEVCVTRGQLFTARTYVDARANREADGVSFEVNQRPGAPLLWSGFVQAGRYRHPPAELQVFDANFVLAGIGAQRAWETGAALTGSLFTGRENDTGGNPSGNRRIVGLSAGADTPLAGRLSFHASATGQAAAYQRVDPAFQVQRHDRRADTEIALDYQAERDLRIRLGVRSTRQVSNVPLFTYSRHDAGLTVRRDFR